MPHQNLFIESIHLRVLNVDGRNARQFEMIESSHQQTLSDTEFRSWPPTQTHDPNQHGRPYCQTTDSWEVWFLLRRLSPLLTRYTSWIWTAKDCERLRTDLKERPSTMLSIARAVGGFTRLRYLSSLIVIWYFYSQNVSIVGRGLQGWIGYTCSFCWCVWVEFFAGTFYFEPIWS